MSHVIHKDIIVFGGGVAGLWLLNRLRRQGYDALLFDSQPLGSGQTIASQGMIHGGVKYALGGALTPAANTIADMPALWKACITGQGELDLEKKILLSERYFMWPAYSVRSRLTAFLGSKALRGRVEPISEKDYPEFFRGQIKGPLYQLADIVLDVPALLHALAEAQRAHIHHINWQNSQLERDASGRISALQLPDLRLSAERFIFTSGEGTEALLQSQSLPGPAMQRRPLHMVLVEHSIRTPLYVHCIADQFSSTPELTITTHVNQRGRPVWYLGGAIAEEGNALSSTDQIKRAQDKLRGLFPWCDFSKARWASFFINRAEPRQEGGRRPDSIFAEARANYMVCWPTKLTLAPLLASTVLSQLAAAGIHAAGVPSDTLDLPFPGIAEAPWDTLLREDEA